MRRAFWIAIGAIFLAFALSAEAAAPTYPVDAAIWIDKAGDLPHPTAVGIAVPRTAGGVTLSRLHGFTPGGFDNAAQYRNADDSIFATVYIYRPTLANAGNAMIVTDAVIRASYGDQTQVLGDTLAPVGGLPNGAHRRVYDRLKITQAGAQGDGGPQASVLMAMQAGDWLVKIRVTGSSAQRDEIAAVADRLLATLKFDKKALPVPAALDHITDCLDSADTPAATRVTSANGAVLSLMVIMGANPTTRKNPPVARDLCIMRRGSEPGVALVLRATNGPAEPQLLLYGDTGTAVAMLKPLEGISTGPAVLAHGFDRVTMFGPFDRLPNAAQLLGLLKGEVGWLGPEISSVSRDAKGNIQVNITTPLAPPAPAAK